MVASEIRALFAVASRPEVVSLAGGMPYVSALPLDAVGRRRRPAGRRARRARAAVRLRAGRRGAARADRRRDDAAGRRPRPPRRRRRHRRLAAGARPRHPRLVRPGRRRPRRGARPTSARCRSSPRTRPRSSTSRWTQGLVPEALRRGPRRGSPPAGRRPSSSTRSRRFHNPAGVTQDRRAGAPRSSQIVPARGVLGPRGRPVRRCSASTARAAARMRADDDDGRRSTSARSPRRSRPGCGSAGRSRRTACARSSCSPRGVGAVPAGVHPARRVGLPGRPPWLDQVKVFRELYRERRDALLESLDAR